MKKTWVKTCGGEDFDVIVECYDGAEKTFPNYWQIYRTSYLLVYKDMMDLLFYKTFKAHKLNGRKGYYWNYIIEMLNITIQTGLRIVNSLDVQFNLNNGTY